MKMILVAVLLGLALSGCGRKGAPSPPGPPADITYPHVYPSQ